MFPKLLGACVCLVLLAGGHGRAQDSAKPVKNDAWWRDLVTPARDQPTGVAAYQQFLLQVELTLKQKDGGENARALLNACPKKYRNFEWNYLMGRASRTGFTLKGHDNWVMDVAFSPDRKTIATASRDHTVYLWEAATGKRVAILEGHKKGVYSVAFHPQGKLIAAGGHDGTIKFWDLKTRKVATSLSYHEDPVTHLAFSPDGAWLASCTSSAQFRIYNLPKAYSKDLEPDSVYSAAFSPDGKMLALCGTRNVDLWSVPEFRHLNTCKGHLDRVNSVAFHPDGKRLISAGRDGIRFWQVPEAKLLRSLTEPQDTPTTALACNHQGTAIATISQFNKALVWYEPFDKPALSFDAPLSSCLAFSPDGQFLAVEGSKFTLRIHDIGEDSTLVRAPDPVWSILPDKDRFLVSMRSGAALFSFVADGGPRQRPVMAHRGQIRAMAAHPQKTLLASAGLDRLVKIWDGTGATLHHSLAGHQGLIRALAFSPDGKHLVSAGEDGAIRIWDAIAGQEVRTLRGHKGMVTAVVFLPEGDRLMSSGGDGTIKIWDVAKGQALRSWTAHDDVVNHLALAQDGKTLASAGADRKVRIWDVADGKLAHTLSAQTSLVQGLAFSPDGKRLATGTMLGGVTLWDPAAGQAVYTFPRAAGPVNAVSFSPDGTRLLSASYDGTIMMWKARPID